MVFKNWSYLFRISLIIFIWNVLLISIIFNYSTSMDNSSNDNKDVQTQIDFYKKTNHKCFNFVVVIKTIFN